MQNGIISSTRKTMVPKETSRPSSSRLSEGETSVRFEQVPFDFDWLMERSKDEQCETS
jgi:hypothetical protein